MGRLFDLPGESRCRERLVQRLGAAAVILTSQGKTNATTAVHCCTTFYLAASLRNVRDAQAGSATCGGPRQRTACCAKGLLPPEQRSRRQVLNERSHAQCLPTFNGVKRYEPTRGTRYESSADTHCYPDFHDRFCRSVRGHDRHDRYRQSHSGGRSDRRNGSNTSRQSASAYRHQDRSGQSVVSTFGVRASVR